MHEKNPCDVCEAKDKASGCDGCVLDTGFSRKECYNDKCMVNYECGCLLGLDDVCKASTCYKDDLSMHDCNECERFTTKTDADGFEYFTCGDKGAQVFEFDTACENFKEA